jgi:hypothetical protein
MQNEIEQFRNPNPLPDWLLEIIKQMPKQPEPPFNPPLPEKNNES